MYIIILNYFLISSIEDSFGDYQIIFLDDNASCHIVKRIKDFFRERHVESMTWPTERPNLDTIKDLWCKYKKKVPEKATKY